LKAAIHQPHYLPYPGFFHKLSLADIFIIMDDVQYDKRFTNRNKILAPQGPIWLSVPINKANKFMPNSVVEINNSIPWREDHWKKLTYSYKNARCFHIYRSYFEGVYKKDWNLLFDLDFETIKAMMGWLGIRVPVVKESELSVKGEGAERLVNACKAVGADTYVSGAGGREYIDERIFARAGVGLEYQEYTPVEYPQRFSRQFVPNLSVVDLLFNLGPDSVRVLKDSTTAAIGAAALQDSSRRFYD
jgi:WbqC-like protein